MNLFITGGSGFLGRRMVRNLVDQGHQVIALVRSTESAAVVEGLGATAVLGDITQRESMREGMHGVDAVFHMAAWHDMGSQDWRMAELTNVSGTRNVLSLAHELEIPRIVYTSTTELFGDTQGVLADESYYTEAPLINHYERTKWQALYQVVLPLIKKGAPIVTVMPGFIYGPEDPSFLGDLMARFYFDELPFPILPGPSTKFAYTHVDDVVAGHLLAWEKGEVGARYILAGTAVSLGELVEFWARWLGKRPPMAHLTRSFLQLISPILHGLSGWVSLPLILSAEATAKMGATYLADATKAKQELGWSSRPLSDGMLATFEYIARHKQRPASVTPSPEQKVARVALATAVIVAVIWVLFGRKK